MPRFIPQHTMLHATSYKHDDLWFLVSQVNKAFARLRSDLLETKKDLTIKSSDIWLFNPSLNGMDDVRRDIIMLLDEHRGDGDIVAGSLDSFDAEGRSE